MAHVRTSLAAALAAALIGVLSPSTALAQQAARGTPSDAADGQASQAAVDAQGRLRQPTPEERRALAAERRAQAERAVDPVPVRRPDGSLLIGIPEHLESVSVAKVEDGTVRTGCFDDAAAAEAFLRAPAAPAAASGEER